MAQRIFNLPQAYILPVLPVAADFLTTYLFSKYLKSQPLISLTLGLGSCAAMNLLSSNRAVKMATPLFYLAYKVAEYVWFQPEPTISRRELPPPPVQPLQKPWKLQDMLPIIEQLIPQIEAKISEEGIYRTSGNKNALSVQLTAWEHDKAAPCNHIKEIHILCGLLKGVLSKSPLLEPQYDHLLKASRLTNEESKQAAIRESLQQLSDYARHLFKITITHLANVSTYQAQNKMTSENLATIFAVVFFKLELSRSSDSEDSISLIKYMIDHPDLNF